MNEYLKRSEDDMLLLLEQLVNIDSGSMDKAGIAKIVALLSSK